MIKGANERGGNGREATQFLQSATLALGVCIHIASVADPQLWFINHFHQPHTRSPHTEHVHWKYEINEDKCEQVLSSPFTKTLLLLIDAR